MNCIFDVDQLPRDCRVAIYGAGGAGRRCAGDLAAKRKDVTIVGFIDTYQTGRIGDSDIVGPEAAAGLDPDLIVVCSNKFPEIVDGLHSLGLSNYTVLARDKNEAYRISGRPEIPPVLADHLCHLANPFFRFDGFVLPCCKVRNRDDLIIGHIDDPNILDAIRSYSRACACDAWRLRPLRDDEPLAVDCLNVEVSLHCQARCAMCCVEAPAWSGRYDYYDTLSRLVDRLHPRSIMVQGGEVLVQKKTMAWLKQIKARHDDISLSLVTNGNAGLAAARDAEDLFDLITVSLVGIQKETYRKIMGLDLDKTLAFIDRLLAGKKTRVHLKYLCTASNIHEAGLFLDQAVAMRTHSISIADSEILKYIDLSPQDDYWFKIFSRTGQDIKNRLLQLRDDPSKNNITVYIEKPLQTIFGIDDAFIEANNLENMLG